MLLCSALASDCRQLSSQQPWTPKPTGSEEKSSCLSSCSEPTWKINHLVWLLGIKPSPERKGPKILRKDKQGRVRGPGGRQRGPSWRVCSTAQKLGLCSGLMAPPGLCSRPVSHQCYLLPLSSFLPPRGTEKVSCSHQRKMDVVSVVIVPTSQNSCPCGPESLRLCSLGQTCSPRHMCQKHSGEKSKQDQTFMCVDRSCVK